MVTRSKAADGKTDTIFPKLKSYYKALKVCALEPKLYKGVGGGVEKTGVLTKKFVLAFVS